MLRFTLPALAALTLFAPALRAQEVNLDSMANAYFLYLDSLEGTLVYHSDTTLLLGDGLAELTVPDGYRYVDPEGAYTVLVDLWGNPPENAEGSLGMLFPEDISPNDENSYGIDIDFTEDGYIEDDDATDIDYDDLLESMQEDTEVANEYRAENGYETVELIGWAAAPRYDAANKRLHWAKELHFEETEGNTLNYNIRFLGRRGYMTMNVIGGMEDLPLVEENLDGVLNSIAYTEGHRYADFDRSTDNVAAYGIAALVAGKVLAKTGLLATIGIFLAKGWKLILVAFVALSAGFKKLLGK
jgi:uncharacterized membrane-anchored protein